MEELKIEIYFNVKDDTFTIGGDVKEKLRGNLISEFLYTQIGKGEDHSIPNEKDIYHITIGWNPQNDIFTVQCNTGNLGLRDGILWFIVGKLEEINSMTTKEKMSKSIANHKWISRRFLWFLSHKSILKRTKNHKHKHLIEFIILFPLIIFDISLEFLFQYRKNKTMLIKKQGERK